MYMTDQSHLKDFERYSDFNELARCELDGKDKNGYFYNQIGYCLKTMSAAVYAYKTESVTGFENCTSILSKTMI